MSLASRTHFDVLGLEASSPLKLALFFELLKVCGTPEKFFGKRFFLEIAWKIFLKTFFFWRALALVSLALGLGLERFCSRPREGLSSVGLSLALASDIFMSLASSLVSSTPPLLFAIFLNLIIIFSFLIFNYFHGYFVVYSFLFCGLFFRFRKQSKTIYFMFAIQLVKWLKTFAWVHAIAEISLIFPNFFLISLIPVVYFNCWSRLSRVLSIKIVKRQCKNCKKNMHTRTVVPRYVRFC